MFLDLLHTYITLIHTKIVPTLEQLFNGAPKSTKNKNLVFFTTRLFRKDHEGDKNVIPKEYGMAHLRNFVL